MYNEFIEYFESRGFDFPCTAVEFIARASEFCAGDEDAMNEICSNGIGQDWREG